MTQRSDVPPSALTGVRILDFTRFVQGPFGTTLLSDLGAEVIKVEQPGTVRDKPSGSFFALHHGKKSITVNLRTAEGLAVVHRLIPRVDVVIENFRPGVMQRLGLGYHDLKKLRPDIILGSASGWGTAGPFAFRGGFDHVAQALSGAMSEQGNGRYEPHALIGGLGDRIGGTFMALGVVSALFVRESTGKGQHVDASLLAGLTQMQAQELNHFLWTGEQHGFQLRRGPTYTHYECQDGLFLAIAAGGPEMFARFSKAIGPTPETFEGVEIAADPRFSDRVGLEQHKDELVALLERLFLTRPVNEWFELLIAADVPCAPVLDYAGVAEHPQFTANDYIVEIDDRLVGKTRVTGPPIHMSETPARIQGPVPEVGEHTEEVLLELGYSREEVEALRECGAL